VSAYTDGPVHTHSRFTRPRAYRTTVADPPRRPRLVVLRSSCRHFLGIGYVWKRQGFITWKVCR
jgi:hypothetical protein